jgi:hypothetical protein
MLGVVPFVTELPFREGLLLYRNPLLFMQRHGPNKSSERRPRAESWGSSRVIERRGASLTEIAKCLRNLTIFGELFGKMALWWIVWSFGGDERATNEPLSLLEPYNGQPMKLETCPLPLNVGNALCAAPGKHEPDDPKLRTVTLHSLWQDWSEQLEASRGAAFRPHDVTPFIIREHGAIIAIRSQFNHQNLRA